MDAHISYGRSQSVLVQRNLLAVAAIVLAIVVVVLFGALAAKNREVVLQPILSRPMTISSSGVTNDYLEAVTRDTAYLILNRSPSSLDYWMDSVLKIVDPDSYGMIKAQLVKIVSEQSNTDISQTFTPSKMSVDPKTLTSQITGELRVLVGDQVISHQKRTYVFGWRYSGVSLSLVRFGILAPATTPDDSAENAS